MKKISVSLWLFLLITIIISAFIVIIPFLKLSERSLEKQTELYKEYNTNVNKNSETKFSMTLKPDWSEETYQRQYKFKLK